MAGKTQGWKLHKHPESGVYRVRFRMGGKRYHRSTGKTDRAEAQSAAARLVRRITEGDDPHCAAPDVPLPELIGSWLAGVRSEVSPETLRTWELYAGAHFIPHFHSADRLCSKRCLRDYMRKRLEEVKARSLQGTFSVSDTCSDIVMRRPPISTSMRAAERPSPFFRDTIRDTLKVISRYPQSAIELTPRHHSSARNRTRTCTS